VKGDKVKGEKLKVKGEGDKEIMLKEKDPKTVRQPLVEET
jgi:hypothetical protein